MAHGLADHTTPPHCAMQLRLMLRREAAKDNWKQVVDCCCKSLLDPRRRGHGEGDRSFFLAKAKHRPRGTPALHRRPQGRPKTIETKQVKSLRFLCCGIIAGGADCQP